MKKQVNSSTSSSKKLKGLLGRLVAFILIFLVLNSFFTRILMKYENKNKNSTVKWREFYNMEEELDLLFVGPSQAYRSYDPYVFDRELGINSFNMGSPLQRAPESYRVTREVLKTKKPKTLVYQMTYFLFNEDKNFRTKVWNYDEFKPSLNKLGYLIDVFDLEEYPYAAFKSLRLHENTEKAIKDLLDIEFENKHYQDDYKGKGFLIVEGQMDMEEMYKEVDRELEQHKDGLKKEYPWNKKQLRELKRLMKLCNDEGIELILVTAPISPTYLDIRNSKMYDYDLVREDILALAKEYGAEYIDYNILDLVTDDDFQDKNHLNYQGATKVSEDLAKRLGEISKKLK